MQLQMSARAINIAMMIITPIILPTSLKNPLIISAIPSNIVSMIN